MHGKKDFYGLCQRLGHRPFSAHTGITISGGPIYFGPPDFIPEKYSEKKLVFTGRTCRIDRERVLFLHLRSGLRIFGRFLNGGSCDYALFRTTDEETQQSHAYNGTQQRVGTPEYPLATRNER